jgi:putative spermidine/putrescine transport system substrate-binding protein
MSIFERSLDRRAILKAGSFAAVTSLAGLSACKNGAVNQGEVVVVSYGGSYQEALRHAFFDPFTAETGIKVRDVEWSGEYAKLQAMVKSGAVAWDLVNAAEANVVQRGIADGLLAKIDYSHIDKTRFFKTAVTDWSVGYDFFSTVLAYRTDSFDAAHAPKDWKDFWNVTDFPGARCLRNDPRTTLEFALLADGVPKDKLYPLDIDRAFASLDRIAPHVTVWWTSGHQPVQLLANKEVVMASVFNGRIWTAVRNDHLPLGISWGDGALDTDTWIIPKGAPNYANAMKLIEFTARPEVQLGLTKYISYGPTMPEAFKNLKPETVTDLPTAPQNFPKQFAFDGAWWAANEVSVRQRWDGWMSKHQSRS